MNLQLLERLSVITPEEQRLVNGQAVFDWKLYMQDGGSTVNSEKLLSAGKMVTVRPHTRFVEIPEHIHDYVEVVYMCSGRTTHFVGGKQILLQAGELLFISQGVSHQTSKAEQRDLAVNFIVLPAFFAEPLSMIGKEQTPLRHFLTGCLCGQGIGPDYLHFQVADIPAVQNLVENMLFALTGESPNKQRIVQTTMALLFVELLDHTERLIADTSHEAIVLKVLRYLESHYATCSLEEMAATLHHNPNWLCRKIKRKTGKTYTQLVQEKRLSQAAFLLKTTDRNVAEIAVAVGYENVSYFHRIFLAAYGMSPKHFRDS